MDRTFTDANGCRYAGVPLGGIGAGSLEIRPDGHFHRWLLMNNKPWGSAPATTAMEGYGLRFGLMADFGEGPRCFALEKHLGLDPGLDGWFWFSDPYHLPWVQHASEIDYTARLPFAELAYRYDDLPLDIRLTAWSPFIPGQSADSNTPGAVLTFTIENRADGPCDLTLFGLLKNAVGYDYPELVSSITRVSPPLLGERGPGGEGTAAVGEALRFSRAGLDADAVTQGSMALSVLADTEHEVTWAIHPRHGRDLWDALRENGRLEDTDYGVEATGPVGEIGAETEVTGPRGMQRGALGAVLTLGAGETATVTFLLTWHFPNFIEIGNAEHPATTIGVQYANRFGDAVAVAGWLATEHDRLLAETSRFADAFYATTLPAWELAAIAAGFSVLTRAAWWDASGRFGIWEGIGCCGLQTVDVGHYASQATLQLFPELDAAQNRLTAHLLEPNGKVPHTVNGAFTWGEVSGNGRGRIDLCAQYALAVWRNALWTGDLDEARALWPVVEQNIAWLRATDENGDGLPDNQGPDQTYDRFPLHGTSAYVGVLYLGSLQAASEIAHWLGEEEKAGAYAAQAVLAHGTLVDQLWNGAYFNLSHDTGTVNTGCMTDQVNGDWFVRQHTGEGLLDDTQVRTALRSVIDINRRTNGNRAWLPNCTWPRGGAVKITPRGSDQANCPWSGVEYSVAAHLALLGERDLARQTAWDVFLRHEDAGMRTNHVECGEFYYRAMSVWSLYMAEFGIAYDALTRTLRVSPPEGDATFLVILPGGMAQATWTEATGELGLETLSGTMAVERIIVRGARS